MNNSEKNPHIKENEKENRPQSIAVSFGSGRARKHLG